MKPFSLVRPHETDSAVAMASLKGARYIAGGTNLVDLLKLGVERPEVLVDVTRLPLDLVTTLPDGSLQVGATVRNSDLAAHEDVRRRFPVLSQAVLSGASGQIRNAATVGGNLLQRTRCPYFQDVGKPCNKRRPGSGCPALTGEHHDLAILGGSGACIATHPSDMAVALVALDAIVCVQTPDGGRELPLEQMYVLPGDDPSRETVLPEGALITAIRLPSTAADSAYRKARERASFAFALGSVAAAVDVRDDRIAEVRLAFGAVAPVPWRAHVAEEMLAGRPLDATTVREALRAEFAAARPLRDNGYKVGLVTAMAERLLLELGGRA